MVTSGEMWVEERDKSGIGDDHIHTDSVGSSVVSTLWDAMDCSLPGFSVPGILQARMLVPFPSPGDLPNPGMELRSPAW